ncbi:MAG: hypothetical protein OXT69_13710 [Candidatus Poribacteria bacterium]|nr:hypothetical protein [Candidatus Poribacteria bacterium]
MATAYDANGNSVSDEETITVTSSAESDDENGDESDGENGGDSSANAPAAQSYPLLEVYAGCGKMEWWYAPRDSVPDFPLLLEGTELAVKNAMSASNLGAAMVLGRGAHLMRLKVTPSFVGDLLKYSRGELWEGVAIMRIDKDRPGGNVHTFFGDLEGVPDMCLPSSPAEINESLPHPLDEKGTGVEVYIKVAQKTGWQATLGALTAAFGLGSTKGLDDLEVRYSPSVQMESVPLEGEGSMKGSGVVHIGNCPAPLLPGTTHGKASAYWVKAPTEAKVEPPAWAKHVSPDGDGGSNEDCKQGVGTAQAQDETTEEQ